MDKCASILLLNGPCLDIYFTLGGLRMPQPVIDKEQAPQVTQLHLLSKELEDAANVFLMKVWELEKLLPFVDE